MKTKNISLWWLPLVITLFVVFTLLLKMGDAFYNGNDCVINYVKAYKETGEGKGTVYRFKSAFSFGYDVQHKTRGLSLTDSPVGNVDGCVFDIYGEKFASSMNSLYCTSAYYLTN